MKQAYHAANPVDAQLVVDLLASEGIAAFTQGQYLSGAVGELPAGELLLVWVGRRRRRSCARRDRRVARPRRRCRTMRSIRLWRAPGRVPGRAGRTRRGLALRERLLAAWSEPQRRYHTMRHLGDCLALFEDAAHWPGSRRRWRSRSGSTTRSTTSRRRTTKRAVPPGRTRPWPTHRSRRKPASACTP
jgi:hypothetical protein